MKFRSVAGLTLVFLFGCAGPRTTRMPENSLTGRLISNVPFFPDDTDQCGPSTLASVLNYWHEPISPLELRKEIYVPKLHGTLPLDILPAVEAHGLNGKVYSGNLDDLRQNINEGYPLLAYLNLGYTMIPIGHYVVITGYDDDRGGVFIHSGKYKNRFVPYKQFLKNWDKTERWTLLVTPKSV